MTTIINTPNAAGNGESDSGAAILLVVIILIVLGALFIWPGFVIRRGADTNPNTGGTNINVTIPAPTNNTGTVPAR